MTPPRDSVALKSLIEADELEMLVQLRANGANVHRLKNLITVLRGFRHARAGGVKIPVPAREREVEMEIRRLLNEGRVCLVPQAEASQSA